MSNSRLVGQLRVMAAAAPNMTVARYTKQAANAIQKEEITEADCQEVIGALELIAENCRAKEASILNCAVRELERTMEAQRQNVLYLPVVPVGWGDEVQV